MPPRVCKIDPHKSMIGVAVMNLFASIACIGLALSSAGVSVAAGPRIASVSCETCTSGDAFREAARASGHPRVMVYNLPANTLSAWHMRRGTTATGEPALVEATPPADALRELDAAHAVYRAAGGTLRPVVRVPVSALDLNPQTMQHTARHLVSDFNMQGMVASAAADGAFIDSTIDPALRNAFARLWQARGTELGLRAQSALVYRVTFQDGSSAEFENTPDSTIAHYREGSAGDADGQPYAAAGS